MLLTGLFLTIALSLGILVSILIAFAKRLRFSIYICLSILLLIPPFISWLTVKILYFVTSIFWPPSAHEIPSEILMQLQSSSAIIIKMMSIQIALIGFTYLLLLVKKIILRFNCY
ncbi:MAG: hypothetical protein APR63_00830 [Desulfuromonas sp. SDB]|nr:MAG: hypothetical protein APR63_00830 [Desulfuromonas sp. SDB]